MSGELQDWLSFLVQGRTLFVVVIALGAGMFAGTAVWRSKKSQSPQAHKQEDPAFFKGVQYILSNDHDHAIEEFTKSVRVNSDTIETYVALGNLYRSKGDIDRAVRIRQSIILRPNIDDQIKLRALFDLGLDYRKGGFLNRSLKIFLDVARKEPSNLENLKEIERIYEELKEWEKAYHIRQRIAKLMREDQGNVLAHHLAEAGKAYQTQGDFNQAKSCFNKAISANRACVDAYLHLGDLYSERGDYRKAIGVWKRIFDVAPEFLFLCYGRLEGAYARLDNLMKPIGEFLQACVERNPDAFSHMALARYYYNEQNNDGALDELAKALELNPSLWEARRFKGRILLGRGREPEALKEYRELLDLLTIPHLRFQCRQCGFESKELLWQCPQCKLWDSIKPMDVIREPNAPVQTLSPELKTVTEESPFQNP